MTPSLGEAVAGDGDDVADFDRYYLLFDLEAHLIPLLMAIG